ncbi:MAG TPA: diaminopimelate epimerase [Thermomicrobiaceae bacterium]|nr:diaminopimelate epimerase [Thermomicrobiaceae bacterium]
MPEIPFRKLSGAGNDFILIDERECELDPAWLAQHVCRRARSLGADGLILVGPDPAGVRVRFYNPDGSRAELCGNGSRCAARDAVERGLASGPRFTLLSDSGALAVEARPDGSYAVAMPVPSNVQPGLLAVEVRGEPVEVHALRVGVPHAVLFVPDVEAPSDDELTRLGRALRHDPAFPAGANVNLVTPLPRGGLRQRTYERGVEALTLACGTGATASATMAHQLLGRPWPVSVQVDGGRLTIDHHHSHPWLCGPARLIARGVLMPDALSE